MGFRQLLSEKERERLVKSHLVRNSPFPSHAQTSGFGEQSFPAENLHRAHSVQGQRLSKGSGSTELFLQGLKSPQEALKMEINLAALKPFKETRAELQGLRWGQGCSSLICKSKPAQAVARNLGREKTELEDQNSS